MKQKIMVALLMLSVFLGTDIQAMPEMAGKSNLVPGSGAAPIVGKILEFVDSSGYTYLLLDRNGVKEWVAIPELYVEVGDEVELEAGVQMGEFKSKPLNKTFDHILFSGGPTEKYMEKRKLNAHKGVNMNEKAPGKQKKDQKIVEGLKVAKAPGENSYTIAEVLVKSVALQDKQVLVRGQVVKVSTSIMERNWVHIMDGTGEKGENRLVVTTQDSPDIGDVVTATGVLHNNVDFGGGYKYAIIMEEATVK